MSMQNEGRRGGVANHPSSPSQNTFSFFYSASQARDPYPTHENGSKAYYDEVVGCEQGYQSEQI